MQAPTWSVAELSPWMILLFVAPFVGSLLGVLIQRLPDGRPVVVTRSACEHCGATLGARDLVPLASYVWLRGRCRHCGEPIGTFHLAIELAAIAAVVWAILGEANPAHLWADCLLGWTLLALGWIDWRRMLLPDVLTLPLLVAGLLLTWFWEPTAIADHAAAAFVGYLSLRGIAWAYRLVRRREGMGRGDAKLLAAAGAWLGLMALPWVVLMAALLGLLMAGVLALSGRPLQTTTALPFGPCLALAFWLAWLHIAWFMNIGVPSF